MRVTGKLWEREDKTRGTKKPQLDLSSHSSCVELGKLLGLSELLFHIMGG